MARRYVHRQGPTKISLGHREPKLLLRLLDDPLLALATAVVLPALDDKSAFPDAQELLFSPWFALFADALESEPQRLRARLDVPNLPTIAA